VLIGSGSRCALLLSAWYKDVIFFLVRYISPPLAGGHAMYDLEQDRRALIQVKGVASFATSYLPSRLVEIV